MSEADAQQVEGNLAYVPIATSLGTSPTEAFSTAFDAGLRNTSVDSQFYNMGLAVQRHLNVVKQRTGQEFDNPLADYQTNPKAPARLANTAQALYELSKKQNDPSLAMPDGDALYAQGIELAREGSRHETEVMSAPISTLGKGAALLGGLAASSTDIPFLLNNTVAMVGFGVGGPLAAAALRSAASLGAAQLGTALGSKDFHQAINPEYGYGDVAKETAFAAGLGAGGELAGAGVAALWRRLRGKAPSVSSRVPQDLADAANVAERKADLEANNPFKTGMSGAQAHHDAITQIEMRLAEGKPPEMPAHVVAEAKVPTGQVFTAQTTGVSQEVQDKLTTIQTEGKAATREINRRAAEAQGALDAGGMEGLRAVADKYKGTPAEVFYDGSRAVDVKYELAEARDLVTSHNRDFMINPAYPAEMQPRERGNVASRAQVYDMAANLEPARLGPSPEANAGSPIVGPDGIVESGNGRVLAIRRAYEMDGAGAYRAFLERSGFDTSQHRQPVLVARRTSEMTPDERTNFSQASNASASLRMGTTEQAMSDARHIDSDLIGLMQGGATDSAANRDFRRAFAGKLPAGEGGGMLTKAGDLAAAGMQRVKAAIVARSYGDAGIVSRAFEHPDSNIKTIANALTDAAPDWLRMRDAVTHGAVPPTHDITSDLMAAVKAIMRARDEGKPVWEILNQGDMFHSDTASLAANLFFKDGSFRRFLSKGDMATNLQTLAKDIASSAERGPDMFGTPPITPKEAIEARGVQAQPDLLTPEILAKIPDDPKVHDAMVADLQRNIEQGNNRVPVMDENGNVSLGFADKELHDIELQEMLAREVDACAGGPPIAEAAE